MSTLILNCWIQGDDYDDILAVEIPSGKDVEALKEAITDSDSDRFQGIDAVDLDLWQVSIAFDDSYEENMEKLDLTRLRLLSPRTMLSSRFANHMEDHLDVIVKAPSASNRSVDSRLLPLLKLNCLVFGDPINRIFSVEIPATKNVADLKDVIKEKNKIRFQYTDASDLALWQVSIPVDGHFNEQLGKLDLVDGRSLPAVKRLGPLFPGEIEEESVHIIVKPPPEEPRKAFNQSVDSLLPPLLKLNCLVFGDPIDRIFEVKILANETVIALRTAIKEEIKPAFDHIPVNALNLWKVSIPVDDHFSERLEKLDLVDGRSLPAVKRLGPLFPGEIEEESVHIIVKPPPEEPREQEPLERIKDLVGDVANLILHVHKFNQWKEDDIRHPRNDIDLRFSFDEGQPVLSGDTDYPEFVVQFLYNLKKKRKLSLRDQEKYRYLETILRRRFSDFFEIVEEDANVVEHEIRAYIAAMIDCAPNVATINTKSSFFKESHFTVFTVDPVFRTLEGYDKGVTVEPMIIVQEINQSQAVDNAEGRRYSPKSDFALKTPYGPAVLNETISLNDETDRNRMLLQAAVYVRVGNELRKNNRDLIIPCFYVNKKFEVERYLVYQPPSHNGRRVGMIHDQVFKLSDPLDCFRFLFELFNYLDIYQTLIDGFDPGKKTWVNLVSNLVKQTHKHALSSKNSDRGDGGQSGKNAGRQSSKGNGGSGTLPTIHEHAASLLQYGYRIIENLKHYPHLAIAESKSHERYIVKVVNKSNEELDIIKYLTSSKLISDTRNHVVPVKAIVETNDPSKCIIVMPKMLPLSELPREIGPMGADELPRQTIEGFAFLHEHGIAHLDIKPKNIVIDTFSKRVHIIDFDLACRVHSVEDTVSGYVGTEDWTAPEVEDHSTYSAIRADLWAIGHLVQYIVAFWPPTHIDRILKVSDMLMEKDPLRRPMLKDIQPEFYHTTIGYEIAPQHGEGFGSGEGLLISGVA